MVLVVVVIVVAVLVVLVVRRKVRAAGSTSLCGSRRRNAAEGLRLGGLGLSVPLRVL